MRLLLLRTLIALSLLALPVALLAKDSGWGVDFKAGSLGAGADISRSLLPGVLNFRAGGSFFKYTANFSDENINYDGRLKLGAANIGIDVYPFKNWFRLGGGVLVNLNEVDATAIPKAGTVTISGHLYSADQFGQLDGKVKFNRAAPFFALGIGNPVKKGKHWGFFMELGAMYHGRPNATLSIAKSPIPTLADDLKAQETRFNNDARRFTFYPIVQLGFSYQF